MKFILILFFVSLVVEQNGARQFFKGRKVAEMTPAGVPGEDDCGMCKTEWFNQTLDHLNSSDSRTWQQRFFSNDIFFDWDKKTGPVFLIIGGETEISMGRMSGFHWHQMANQTKALLLQLEHRYYGESWPLGADSLTTENLKYLSIEQALEDLANFIRTKNAEYELPEDVKWVVWGGSYSGNLAAWSRANYTDLIYAAVASSAPVESSVDFPGYFQVVYEALKGHSEECASLIQNAIDTTVALFQIEGGLELLNSYYNLCNPLKKNTPQKDIINLYLNLAEILSTVVQNNLETTLPQTSQITQDICNVMLDTSLGNPVQRLNSVTKKYAACIFYKYSSAIYYWKDTDIKNDLASQRVWMYQTCTQIGNFQTTTEVPLFPSIVDVDFLIGQCADVFGEDFTSESIYAGVNQTNARYGGRDVKTDRIIWTHGSYDPWHVLGITESDNENSPAYLIERTSHCQDQYSNTWYDLPQMIETRNNVEKYLSKWLSEE